MCTPRNFVTFAKSVDRDKIIERNRLYFDVSLTRNTRGKGADELYRYEFSEVVLHKRNKKIQSLCKNIGHLSSCEITGNDTTLRKKKLENEKKNQKKIRLRSRTLLSVKTYWRTADS